MTESGSSLRVRTAEPRAAGERLFLVLGPESLGLLAPTDKAPDAAIGVPGVVRSRIFLGKMVEYSDEVAGARLQGTRGRASGGRA